MAIQVFQEENHNFQFDFSTAIWASDELHDIFQHNHAQILSDADFIVETENSIVLVEYKNAAVPGAAHPERFCPSDQKTLHKIAYKYYDSWIYLKAIGSSKPIEYVYILEYPKGDSVSRKMIREKIADLLPFKLQKHSRITTQMISDFSVLSIDEWNQHSKYKQFPISKVAT